MTDPRKISDRSLSEPERQQALLEAYEDTLRMREKALAPDGRVLDARLLDRFIKRRLEVINRGLNGGLIRYDRHD